MNDNPTMDELRIALRYVTREAILIAIGYYRCEYPDYDYDNWLDKNNYKYAILYHEQRYPPKYIMGLATDIHCRYFAGGWGKTIGVNPVFEREGFTIINK